MSETLTSESPLTPRPGSDANFGYLFRLAHQHFRAVLERELEGLHLSAQEYGILSVFETRPELSTAELARISQVTRQTMHSAVISLEGAGLLERRAANRRVVLMRLTAQGRERLAAATVRVRAVERAALAGLSGEDQSTVRSWLAGLVAMTVNPQIDGASTEEP